MGGEQSSAFGGNVPAYRDLSLTSLTLPLDIILEMLKVIQQSPAQLSPEARAILKTEIEHSFLLLNPFDRDSVDEIVKDTLVDPKGSQGSPTGLL